MKPILLLIFSICITISATSQQRVSINAGQEPYCMVDSFTVELRYLLLSPDKIESVDVLKDSNAVAAYGEKAKYGAVIIKTKPHTKLLRVSDIITKYKIPQKDKALRISINNTLVNHPELFLIEESEILGVEITTERFWIHAEDANKDERFINIKTRNINKDDSKQ